MTPDEARLFAPSFCSQNRAGGPGRQSKSLLLRLGKRLETDFRLLADRSWVTRHSERSPRRLAAIPLAGGAL